jgi:hypothetical protein
MCRGASRGVDPRRGRSLHGFRGLARTYRYGAGATAIVLPAEKTSMLAR